MDTPSITELDAEAFIRTFYPDVVNVSFVNHGYDNLVALADETYTFRFPRNEQAYKQNDFEQILLRALETLKSFQTPKIIASHKNPWCLVTSFLKGKHLHTEEIQAP